MTLARILGVSGNLLIRSDLDFCIRRQRTCLLCEESPGGTEDSCGQRYPLSSLKHREIPPLKSFLWDEAGNHQEGRQQASRCATLAVVSVT